MKVSGSIIIVRLSRILKTLHTDIVSILIGIAYGTGIFNDIRNIEIAY